MTNDADRYVWLLAHMGLVHDEARRWQPGKDKPLLIHLHDFITRKVEQESKEFIEAQRKLLHGQK